MKSTFSGWYSRDAEQLANLWDRALFVPDTNILLHCLRHSSEVREELLRIFELLSQSLWIPYQVGLEFHRHRLDVEAAAADAYDRLIKEYEGILGRARETLRQLRAHPSISVDKELSALDMFESDFRGRIERARAEHPTQQLAAALERVTTLFNGRVGSRPMPEKMALIRKEGEERYAKRIPPGYKDARKDGTENDKFGDLIIWKDLLQKAKADQRPLIFISDDAKEDWWQIHRGRKLGPRPELLEEFRVHTAQDFHIYELGQFLRIASRRHGEIAQSTVEQIERSVREDDEARRRGETVGRDANLRARVVVLENERDSIISALAGVPSFEPKRQKNAPDTSSMRSRLAEIDSELVVARTLLDRRSDHAIPGPDSN